MNTIVFLTLSGPLLLAAVALLSRFETGTRSRYVLGASRLATLTTCVLAVGSAVYVAIGGPGSTDVFGVDPIGFSIRLDALSATLFLLVAFVGAVAVQFSRNYLEGEKRQGVFMGHMCLTLCAVIMLVLSGSLFQMVVAWIATSIALHCLLLFYSDRPRAVAAARKKFICARVADGFLIVAVVLLYLAFYDLAKSEFGAVEIDGGPWCSFKNPKTGTEIVVKDVIADAFLQQILLRPKDYSVIATLNLNGDYISDALAAQVGGIGMAPGANLSDSVAMFEATHGTAPKYAGKDQVNPSSLILSAEMMLRHMGWVEAADLIIKGVEGAIAAKTVTYDLDRLMDGATKLSCSGFGAAVIGKM